MDSMIKVEDVSMKFNLGIEKNFSLKLFFINMFKPKKKDEKKGNKDFWALKHVNFEVERGEVVGFVGGNGAGKSTLLKVVSGVMKPTEGKITDSMRAKGMPEGKSELGGQVVYVKDGTARLEDGTIAGSVLTYIKAFQNIIKFTGVSIEDAVKMSSGNQAKEFGLTQKGAIKTGKDADFVLLDEELELKGTISFGEMM